MAHAGMASYRKHVGVPSCFEACLPTLPCPLHDADHGFCCTVYVCPSRMSSD